MPHPGGRVDWRTFLPKTLADGALVGQLTGLFGVDGGFVLVLTLSLLLGLGAQQALVTSLVVVVINSVDGIVAHAGAAWRRRLHRAAVRWHVAGGVHCGRLVVHEAEPGYRTLRRWFACVVLAVLVAAAVIVNSPRWDDIGPDS